MLQRLGIFLFFLQIFVIVLIGLLNYQKISDLDINTINHRRNYYPPVISRIFQNKVTQSILSSRKTFFNFFDLNTAFK